MRFSKIKLKSRVIRENNQPPTMSIYAAIVVNHLNREYVQYFQTLPDAIDYVLYTLTRRRLTHVNTLEELSKLNMRGKWIIQPEEYDPNRFIYLVDTNINGIVHTSIHRELDMAIHRAYQRLSRHLMKTPDATPSTLREMNALSLPEDVNFRIILSIIE